MNLQGIKKIIYSFNNKYTDEIYIRIKNRQQREIKFNYYYYCDSNGLNKFDDIKVANMNINFKDDKTPLLYFSMPKEKIIYIYDVEENSHFSLIRAHLDKNEKYFITYVD